MSCEVYAEGGRAEKAKQIGIFFKNILFRAQGLHPPTLQSEVGMDANLIVPIRVQG
jgi:hypothetical protein